jgi:hypothetical protein
VEDHSAWTRSIAVTVITMTAIVKEGSDPVHRTCDNRRLALLRPARALLALTVLAAGCGSDADTAEASAPIETVVSDDRAIVTFEVADRETFRVELTTSDLVAHARGLLAGENLSAIPLGTVVRDDAGPNAPWTWHLDPATVEFAFATIEVCDGVPSDVENGTVTSGQYCPWSAEVIAVDPVAG